MKRSKLVFEIVCIIITVVIMTAFWFVVGYVLDNIAKNNRHDEVAISQVYNGKNFKKIT